MPISQTFNMELNTIYNEPCLETINRFEPNSIDCVITSPPYWQLRDYGYNGQWGLEPNTAKEEFDWSESGLALLKTITDNIKENGGLLRLAKAIEHERHNRLSTGCKKSDCFYCQMFAQQLIEDEAPAYLEPVKYTMADHQRNWYIRNKMAVLL